MGSLMFAQEMQNQPIAAEGLAFKKAWVQYFDLSNPPNFNWIYAGVDPAVGKSDIASFTALVLVRLRGKGTQASRGVHPE